MICLPIYKKTNIECRIKEVTGEDKTTPSVAVDIRRNQKMVIPENRYFLVSLSAFLLSWCIQASLCDTPANCTYEDIRGTWLFYETERSFDRDVNCSVTRDVVTTTKVELLFPNIAVDAFGNKGYWTIIYNQGFEVVVNYRKYFAFSSYKDDGQGNVTSYCDKTLPGWSHDALGHNWACFVGKKVRQLPPKYHFKEQMILENRRYKLQKDFLKKINAVQTSWYTRPYAFYESLSLEDHLRRAGGKKSRVVNPPPPAAVSNDVRRIASTLPDEFDWRNVNGINYVSPVRDQGKCGSCYAFASMGMIESRLRVMSNNTIQVTLSPQDVVSCSEYSQGCEGGFPYLIAGKYAQDFGLTEEKCNPYKGVDSECSEQKCLRRYVFGYGYVGGFYGGCNEELTRIALVKNGPVAVSFEVYGDFLNYGGGIYHHTGLKDGFNPFGITNHVVVLVGYGVDKTSAEKYWIVKNSWGTDWGEDGFFRIRRGTNECNIETMAVEASPIP